jgi:hypothetical protein
VKGIGTRLPLNTVGSEQFVKLFEDVRSISNSKDMDIGRFYGFQHKFWVPLIGLRFEPTNARAR